MPDDQPVGGETATGADLTGGFFRDALPLPW